MIKTASTAVGKEPPAPMPWRPLQIATAKMTSRVGLAIAVMTAMALGHIQQGRPAQMRSLVQPIPATG